MRSLPAIALLVALLSASDARAETDFRAWQPVEIAAGLLPDLLGSRVDSLLALRCADGVCSNVPLQVDERDEAGEWVLPNGVMPTADDPDATLDENDVVLFMWSDAGSRDEAGARLAGGVAEIEIVDPLGFPPRYLYLSRGSAGAAVSPLGYVSYDSELDRLEGRVSLGFADGIPQLLALEPGGENVLDRLKIRATATFLWGLISITRTEQDLLPEGVTWKSGPIRVIRRQPLQIRIRFGLRSPRFTSTTFFYRDFASLPLTIRLRVPPRRWFTSIRVFGGLDFRNLPGEWSALLPDGERLPAGCRAGLGRLRRDGVSGGWFALEGERMTIVQRLERSPSLESVRLDTWYRNGDLDDPPENAAGQCPAAGFTLDDWDGVEGGVHTLVSTSYALPPDTEVGLFLAAADTPLETVVRSLPGG